MVLARQEIRRLLSASPPLVESYVDVEAQLQPNGFDLSVRDVSRFATPGGISTGSGRVLAETALLPFDGTGLVTLPAGSYLLTFSEIVNIPRDLMALGRPRSSLLRCGVTVGTAVWDAGYSGRSQSLLVVHNQEGFRLQKHARVMQLVFFRLSAAADETYRGVFQKENI